MGNRYFYNHERTLVEIEQYLAIPGTEQLTWFVYETPGSTYQEIEGATYSKVFEKVTVASGTQFHSSGAISFPIDPAKTYIIGVRSGGTCTAYYGAAGQQFLSNGQPSGRLYLSASSGLPTSWMASALSNQYNQRLSYE